MPHAARGLQMGQFMSGSSHSGSGRLARGMGLTLTHSEFLPTCLHPRRPLLCTAVGSLCFLLVQLAVIPEVSDFLSC